MAGEEAFLRQKFKEFYEKNSIESVPDIELREFGIGSFGKKIFKRHISFKNFNELNSYLRKEVPLYISYSAAYYKFPSKTPMNAKEFLGADLVYEFDADDLKTDCKQKHDSWHCPKCNAHGNGLIENCTECGSTVSVKEMFCDKCLNETKKQLFLLIDFIESDFGFSDGISVNFSGRAGYHLHVRSKTVRQLSRQARVELLDYVTGKDLNLLSHGFLKSDKMLLCPKPKQAIGWSKKIISNLRKLIEEADSEKIASFTGFPHSKVKDFLKNREKILEGIDRGVLFSFPGKKTELFWNSLLARILEEISLKVDRQTSIDLNKIVRVPETLHGGTGLVAKNIPLERLKEFNPLNEAIVFDDAPVKVFIKHVPKFNLGKQFFGPFKNVQTELPAFAAIYLVAGNMATLL